MNALKDKSDAVNKAVEEAIELIRFYSSQYNGDCDDGSDGSDEKRNCSGYKDDHDNGDKDKVDKESNKSKKERHHNKEENPWNQPDDIFNALDTARTKLINAWDDLEQECVRVKQREEEENVEDDDWSTTKNNKTKKIKDQQKQQLQQLEESEKIKVAYIDMITDAFADALEDMRQQEGDNLDVDVLIDCLQSGLDLMSKEEKELFLIGELQRKASGGDGDANDKEEEEVERMVDKEEYDTVMTPHERRRRELGFGRRMVSEEPS